MNISKKRLEREFGDIIRHNSLDPERDLADLHAVLTGHSKVSVKLDVANEILGYHGVEMLADERAGESVYDGGWLADYCNSGDSYGITLLWDGHKLHITTWADFYERWERKLPRALQNAY